MELVIISPSRRLFKGSTDSVTFPGEVGSFTVLTGHAPIISSLTGGEITFVSEGKERLIKISRGCVRVLDDMIEACVEPGEETK